MYQQNENNGEWEEGHRRRTDSRYVVKDKTIENTTEFVYLRSLLVEENEGSKEIQRKIARATEAMGPFGKIWRCKRLSTGTK